MRRQYISKIMQSYILSMISYIIKFFPDLLPEELLIMLTEDILKIKNSIKGRRLPLSNICGVVET